MITGLGMDLIEIDRIRRVLEGKSADRFLERVLAPEEREAARGKQGRLAEYVAGRFAAKEAVVKALGCGIGELAGFQDVIIASAPNGKPVCRLSEASAAKLGLPSGLRIHITITHTAAVAAATAVAERPDEGGTRDG